MKRNDLFDYTARITEINNKFVLDKISSDEHIKLIQEEFNKFMNKQNKPWWKKLLRL